MTSDQKCIYDQLENIYKDLYSSEANDCSLTTLSISLWFFKKPISVATIDRAIKSMKTGKASGPDGYPIELKKIYVS